MKKYTVFILIVMVLMVVVVGSASNLINGFYSRNTDIRQTSVSFDLCPSSVFDTGKGTYPSISGTHYGMIKPTTTTMVSKLYTYSHSGTGGHTEYVKIWNTSWEVEAQWNGYTGNWQTILFNESFTLVKGQTYNYTIVTGSYPQMHHTDNLSTSTGFITCTEFVDINGRRCDNWIPAIRLGDE